jgi:Domain of unknown function DUF302
LPGASFVKTSPGLTCGIAIAGSSFRRGLSLADGDHFRTGRRWRASLYAPLRVLIYEEDDGKTCVEYDRPSSLFGPFRNDRIAPTAAMLDRKLEALVAEAFK